MVVCWRRYDIEIGGGELFFRNYLDCYFDFVFDYFCYFGCYLDIGVGGYVVDG